MILRGEQRPRFVVHIVHETLFAMLTDAENIRRRQLGCNLQELIAEHQRGVRRIESLKKHIIIIPISVTTKIFL
jgi:hypothetical protein